MIFYSYNLGEGGKMKNLFLNNQIKMLKILIVMMITLFLNGCGKTPNDSNYNIESSFESASKLYCMIDLRGEVMRPGIYKIESGSLVNDVIELAGGFTKMADKNSVNLVMSITSNMKIVINTINDVNDDQKTQDVCINLNTCNKEQLLSIPRIGEVKANAILSYRETYGGFQSVEDLLKVSGIGDALYSQIKIYFTV